MRETKKTSPKQIAIGDPVYIKGVVTEIHDNGAYTIQHTIVTPFVGEEAVGPISTMVLPSEFVLQSEQNGL